jgi:quinohemoprotein ethanol dehydrogenase
MLAFKLGAKVELPPIPPPTPVSPPPRPTAREDVIQAGQYAYTTVCAQCHGRDAISINAIPDLRQMNPQTRAEFNDIVLKGSRASKGMVSFADQVSPAQADAIYQYLTARAWDDWNK